MSFVPDAILQLGGVRATANPFKTYPGTGFNSSTEGEAVGSHWVDTRTTGALSSDYSQFRYARAGVTKYRHGVNLAGDGADDWVLKREGYATDATERDFLKFTRETGRADFYGPVYSNGTLLSGGIPVTGGTMTGKLVVGIGAISTSTSTENPVSASTWVSNFANQIALHLYAPDPFISMFANTDGANTQSPSGKIRWGGVGMSSDNGVRLQQNLAYFPSGTSPKLFDPTLPRGNFGFDHDGTLSYSWDPAAIAGSGYDYRAGLGTVSNNPYVPIPGQSLVIFGQGRAEGGASWEFGNVDICTMRGGQTMRFGTSGTQNDPRFAMQITGHVPGGPGNVNIFRQAVIGGISGIANIRLQNVGSVTGANDGSIWYDGSNYRGRLAA